MRPYDYTAVYGGLLTPDLVGMVGQIHEYKGEQRAFLAEKAGTAAVLLRPAQVRSIGASCRLDGIPIAGDRLERLMQKSAGLNGPDEQAVAGYRDVLASIHKDFSYLPLNPPNILWFHRGLYQYNGKAVSGVYKTSNRARERSPGLAGVSAWETPKAVELACAAYNGALESGPYDPLLLIPVFILDFLCIRPFSAGSGRMSRLLTLLLLNRAGYLVGKYISIEKQIEDTKESYYEALRQSFQGWREGTNDYAPFVRYLLGVVLAAYRAFLEQVRALASGLSKPDRVRAIIRDAPGPVTKSGLMRECPDVSQITVQRALSDLVKSGEILKRGGGRYTSYIWNKEKNT